MTTKGFIDKLKNDRKLAEKMSNVSSADEAYRIAKDNGVTDNQKTFFQEMKMFRDEVSKITPEDMGTLVGNASTSEIVSAVSTWTGAAAAAGAAAA